LVILSRDPSIRSPEIESLRIENVTGDDVELPVAGPGGRSYAFIIDWHIRLLLALFWLLIATLVTGVRYNTGLNAMSFVVFGIPALIYLLYHPAVELAMGGQTPGKRMAGVRIVARNGQPPSVGAILIRNVFRLIDSLPAFYTVGLLSTIVTRDSVRIGDLAAGTVLVYVPGSSPKSSRPQLVRARQTRLAPEELELVSDVLDRWSQLEPATRRQLAIRLLIRAGLPGTDADDLDDARLATALRDLLAPQT
jgi:uncharacterized RDD family membrane protein YckC